MRLLPERLRNQQLARSEARSAADVVSCLGAVQAQDYAGAKWALGVRAAGLTDALVEDACTRGQILRTHVLRPTWHFVTPADIRWMLALTAPRVRAAIRPNGRRLGLDDAIVARSRRVLERALRGRQLTRAQLGSTLARAGIRVDGPALAQLMMHAELEGVVCSGAREGHKFTYALLDERAPRGTPLRREEGLGELARRYLGGHGPATLRDFAWWSGLTMGDARQGIESVGSSLERRVSNDRVYWSVRVPGPAAPRASAAAHLLPNYDEYLVAYKDRDPVAESAGAAVLSARGADFFTHSLVVNGRVAGSWRKTSGRESVRIEVVPYRALTPGDRRALASAAERYGRFIKQAVTWAERSR
jgi:hypothetical protein